MQNFLGIFLYFSYIFAHAYNRLGYIRIYRAPSRDNHPSRRFSRSTQECLQTVGRLRWYYLSEAIKCTNHNPLHTRWACRKTDYLSHQLPSETDWTISQWISLYRILSWRWVSDTRHTRTGSTKWSKTRVAYRMKNSIYENFIRRNTLCKSILNTRIVLTLRRVAIHTGVVWKNISYRDIRGQWMRYISKE